MNRVIFDRKAIIRSFIVIGEDFEESRSISLNFPTFSNYESHIPSELSNTQLSTLQIFHRDVREILSCLWGKSVYLINNSHNRTLFTVLEITGRINNARIFQSVTWNSREKARKPHSLLWGGMASGGLGAAAPLWLFPWNLPWTHRTDKLTK